jgi:beta-glucosidase-like glycosyl hydrolase
MIAAAEIIESTTKPQGGVGGLLEDFSCVRSDCQTILQMLKLGVIPESQVRQIVQKGADMALKCNNSRAYKAIMSVLLEMVKIEQKERVPTKDASTTINVDNRRVIVLPRNGRESIALADG